MTSAERHELRYQRRKSKRQTKRQAFLESLPKLEEIFTFDKMYKYGLECCKGVRWKQSVQNFEHDLVVRTAYNIKRVLDGSYEPSRLKRFKLNERGKTRIIDAPTIDDRQIQKALTKEILVPLYHKSMIYDNGASTQGKGLHFSQNQLDKALRKHINKYGMRGWIILADFKGFFPNADRNFILRNHRDIPDTRIKNLLDKIVMSCPGDKGMPLGVEPSQLEMLRLPSELDNFMCCQVHLKGFGHYMDDYHILVAPHRDPKKIVEMFVEKASEYGMTVSQDKTKILPIGCPFKFCKMKRIVLRAGQIICKGCGRSYTRARRKIKMFAVSAGVKMTFEDIRNSVNSIIAYFSLTNNHTTILNIKKLFYKCFMFSCENLNEFRRRDNAVYMS